MKQLIHKSKKHVIDKLKYISSIMDLVSDIFKSFATIIGSVASAVTAGITGYFEVKKLTRKRELRPHIVKLGEMNIVGTQISNTTTAETQSTQGNQPYSFDMNSAGLLTSLIVFGLLMFMRLSKKSKTDKKND